MSLGLSGKIYSRLQGPEGSPAIRMWEVALKKKNCTFGWKKHARISRWREICILPYTSAGHFNDSFLNTKLTYKQGEELICFSCRCTYVERVSEYNTTWIYGLVPVWQTEAFLFFAVRRKRDKKCLIQHPLWKEKVMHISLSRCLPARQNWNFNAFHIFLPPPNGEADRHGDVIFTVWTPMV